MHNISDAAWELRDELNRIAGLVAVIPPNWDAIVQALTEALDAAHAEAEAGQEDDDD